MIATATIAGSTAVLIRVMFPVRATGEPAVIVVAPATTAPWLTTTKADTSAFRIRASFVATTSRTRSTSRMPAPGVNSSGPEPATTAISLIWPVLAGAVDRSVGAPPGRNNASPGARRASGPVESATTTAAGPSDSRNAGAALGMLDTVSVTASTVECPVRRAVSERDEALGDHLGVPTGRRRFGCRSVHRRAHHERAEGRDDDETG